MQPAADGLLVVQYLRYFVGIVVRPLSRLVGPIYSLQGIRSGGRQFVQPGGLLAGELRYVSP